MALTTVAFQPSTDVAPRVPGTRRRAVISLTLDASYPTGGSTLTAALCGLTAIHSVLASGATSAGKPVFWTGSKVKVFSAIGTEVSNATDLSGETVVLEVVGI